MANIFGTSIRNILIGTALLDNIFGRAGNDDLFGRGGNDTLNGETGNDNLFGETGNDLLRGGVGNDFLNGGIGADRMEGGTGDDIFVVDNVGDNVIELGGQGYDTVRSFINSTALLAASVERLELVGNAARGYGNTLDNVLVGNALANSLHGNMGNDVLIGGGGVDYLSGFTGHDTILPGTGYGVADTVSGGSGFDTVDYRDASGGVMVWLSGNITMRAAAGDVLTGIENVVGSRFDDYLRTSDAQFSTAFGGAGNDRIVGSGGVYDRLRGDEGNDALVGSGNEEDFWLQYNRGMDFVEGYRQFGQDHVFIDGDEFGLPNTGFLAPEQLGTGIFQDPVPFLGSRRLFYDTSTHVLWADKDGSGGAFAPVPIAVFGQNSAAPTAADIFVF